MSTRCQFIVWEYDGKDSTYKRKLNFYHHHDGYPSYMEKDIKNVIESVSDLNIDTLKNAFPEYDAEYELEDLYTEHGDIEYVWHLYVNGMKAELKYVDLRYVNTEDALYEPEKCKKKFKNSWITFINQ